MANQELAAEVGLTPAPVPTPACRLEAEGVITGYTATVNPAALGREFEVIINADLVAKDLATVEAFEDRRAAMDEVAELRRMFGLPDYFVRVQVADLPSYERWLTTQLLGDPAIARTGNDSDSIASDHPTAWQTTELYTDSESPSRERSAGSPGSTTCGEHVATQPWFPGHHGRSGGVDHGQHRAGEVGRREEGR